MAEDFFGTLNSQTKTQKQITVDDAKDLVAGAKSNQSSSKPNAPSTPQIERGRQPSSKTDKFKSGYQAPKTASKGNGYAQGR